MEINEIMHHIVMVLVGLIGGILWARITIANRHIKQLKKQVNNQTDGLLENSSKERTNRELIRNLQEEHVMMKKRLNLLEEDHKDWVRRLKGEKSGFTPVIGG